MGALKVAGSAVAMLAVLTATLLAVGQSSTLAPVPFVAWFLFFFLDASSTKEMYLRSPAKFGQVERNQIFVMLARRLKLSYAFAAFVACVEIPVFAFISLVVAPALGFYLFGSAPLLPCLAAGAGILAFAHADAWRVNRSFTSR